MARLTADEFDTSTTGLSATAQWKDSTFNTGKTESLLSDSPDTDWLAVGKKVGKGLKATGVVLSYFNQIENLDGQIEAISLTMAETRRRYSIAAKQLKQTASKTMGRQKEAYLASGVKLEGSAMDVVSDTMYDLLEAEMERETELRFAEEQQRRQQENLSQQKKSAAVSTLLNLGTTLLA